MFRSPSGSSGAQKARSEANAKGEIIYYYNGNYYLTYTNRPLSYECDDYGRWMYVKKGVRPTIMNCVVCPEEYTRKKVYDYSKRKAEMLGKKCFLSLTPDSRKPYNTECIDFKMENANGVPANFVSYGLASNERGHASVSRFEVRIDPLSMPTAFDASFVTVDRQNEGCIHYGNKIHLLKFSEEGIKTLKDVKEKSVKYQKLRMVYVPWADEAYTKDVINFYNKHKDDWKYDKELYKRYDNHRIYEGH